MNLEYSLNPIDYRYNNIYIYKDKSVRIITIIFNSQYIF